MVDEITSTVQQGIELFHKNIDLGIVPRCLFRCVIFKVMEVVSYGISERAAAGWSSGALM